MDDKILEMAMKAHLSNTKFDTKAALQRFEEVGIKLDRRFRRDFIKQTTDCVIDTCERFCSESKQKTRKTKHADKLCQDSHTFMKRRQSVNENTAEVPLTKKQCSAERVKHEDKSAIDDAKRQTNTDNVSCTTTVASKEVINTVEKSLENRQFFYYCSHCLDANESGESIGGSIDDVYKHWQSAHINHLPSKPFQFIVAEIAVCHVGDAIGTYRELLKHQQLDHPDEPLAIVSHDDHKKCGICLKPTDSIVEHFESDHKTLIEKDFFNPMQMSDKRLEDLMAIDIHKRRQCGHCDAVFETDESIEIHHSIGHENKAILSVPYNDNRDPVLMCGYCQGTVSRNDYIAHVKTHPYVFKCWKCTYQSKNLVDLVMHDKYQHERDTLDYHCTMFPEWMKSHFYTTKMVFANGLVVRNYNLIGTKFDDTKIFDVFIEGFIEMTKNMYSVMIKDKTSSETATTGTVAPEEQSFLLAELKKQTELVNNLVVLKLPRINNTDLRDLFLTLCNKLRVDVKPEDIQNIHRRPREGREGRDDTIVTLKDTALKEEIRNAAQKSPIFSAEVFDLEPTQWNKQIKVISHTTRYYSEMLSIAKEARTERIISHYEVSARGLHIKRTSHSEDHIFISKSELINFISKSKK